MYMYFHYEKTPALRKMGPILITLPFRHNWGHQLHIGPGLEKRGTCPFFSRFLHKSTTNNLEFKRLGTYFYYTGCCYNPMSDGSSVEKNAPSIRSWFDSDHAPVYLSNLCAYFDDYIIYLSFS